MIAEAEAEKTRIAAEAYKQAAGLKAEGDAQAMRIYADAFGQDAPFYKFLRTLQAYETVLDEQTTLFLPADAEVFQILQGAADRPDLKPGTPAPGRGHLAADAPGHGEVAP
jgi:membrane protease subunit HflC